LLARGLFLCQRSVALDIKLSTALYRFSIGEACFGLCQLALRLIERESFDAVLLDLRSNQLPAEEMLAQIKEMSPSLAGRVLVITAEVTDSKTLEWIEKQCLTPVPGNRLMSELWGRLRALLGMAPATSTRP
jgi:response regulator RpfG family c-di-GMP phosphodiesterase